MNSGSGNGCAVIRYSDTLLMVNNHSSTCRSSWRGSFLITFLLSKLMSATQKHSLVGYGCRIRRLHLCREVSTHSNECSEYDTKQSDGQAPVLELWRMWSTPSLPLFSGPLWPGVVALVCVLSMDQIELFNLLLYLKPFNCMQTNEC